jgi:hypothetical protein
MKISNIVEIAEDRMISDLCLQWFNETDEKKKQEILDKIQELWKKINGKK